MFWLKKASIKLFSNGQPFKCIVKLRLGFEFYFNTYRVSDILSGCGDDGEHQEEGGGGRVMEPEDARVYCDPVRLDQALKAPEDVQHPDLMQSASCL